MASQIPYKQEIMRKLFHVATIILPVSLYIIDNKNVFLWILIPLTLFVVTAELSRGYSKLIDRLFILLFGAIMREHEVERKGKGLQKLTGTSYLLISASLCLYFFPVIVTVAAFLILTISDTCAALIGRKWGKHHFLGKSLEGSIAFFISAVASVGLLGLVDQQDMRFFIIATIASLVATVVEAVSGVLNIDDNFSIPLSFSLAFVALAA